MWSIEGRCGAALVVVPLGFVRVVEGTVVVEGRTTVDGTVVVVVLTGVSIVLPPFPSFELSMARVFSMTLSNCFRAAGVAFWASPLQVYESHRMATVAGISFAECLFMDFVVCLSVLWVRFSVRRISCSRFFLRKWRPGVSV